MPQLHRDQSHRDQPHRDRPHRGAAPPTAVAVKGTMIRLGQLLKLAGVVDAGGDVRPMLAGGRVRVNGTPELRRGRQLHDGDVVSLAEVSLLVSAASDSGACEDQGQGDGAREDGARRKGAWRNGT